MGFSAWRASIRIARRDAWKSKGRSALVVALIGLPIVAIGVGDVAWRTYQLSPTETIDRNLGSASAEVRWEGGPVQQTPSAWVSGGGISYSDSNGAVQPSTADMLRNFPAGTKYVTTGANGVGLNVKTNIGIEYTQQIGLDYSNPIVSGLVGQVSGRAPRTNSEIAITETLASHTGLHVGDTLHAVNPTADYKVVGIVRDTNHNKSTAVYTLPSAIQGDSVPATDWYLSTPSTVTWARILELNKSGYAVVSRNVYLNPPPKSQWPYMGDAESRVAALEHSAVPVLTVVVGLALFEVVLLAGPAFAVGARRQTRNLALIAATGGRKRDLRNVVLSSAIVLGIVSGVVGAIGAIALAKFGIAAFGGRIDAVAGSFDIRPLELGALVVLAIATALAAALFPARAAARTNIVDALAGRRGITRTSRKFTIFGLALVGIGVFVALGGFTAGGKSTGPKAMLGGLGLIELGMIICTPAILGATALFGRLLPLSPRIALRDAGRNRSAAAPAVAAVMATVIGAVAISIGVASATDHGRRTYSPSLPTNYAYLPFGATSVSNSDAVQTAMQKAFPDGVAKIVDEPLDECAASGYQSSCDAKNLQFDPSVASTADLSKGITAYGSEFPNVLISDGSNIDQLLGDHNAQAQTNLQNGKAIVFSPNYVNNGQVKMIYANTNAQAPSYDTRGIPNYPTINLPAVAVTSKFVPAAVIIPPSLLSSTGAKSSPAGVLIANSSAPTDKRLQVARGAAADLNLGNDFYVERGYQNKDQWVLNALIAIAVVIAVGASIIATALANVDSRPDLLTLGAIGASPRTRRQLSVSRSAVISVIGVALGTIGGVLAALAWIRSVQSNLSQEAQAVSFNTGAASPFIREHFIVPSTYVLAIVVGIPLVAALVTALFTRSRLPSERRTLD